MRPQFSKGFIRKALLILLAFVGATAVVGGSALAATNGLGMPLSTLENTPFKSFFIPGIILATIVGGTHLLAFYKLKRHQLDAMFLAAVASFGLMIWLFVEVFLIEHRTILQALYYAIAVLEMMAILGLLNVYPVLIKKGD